MKVLSFSLMFFFPLFSLASFLSDSDFISLEPFQQVKFSITLKEKEKFFSFKNNYDNHDLVFSFAKGNGYSTYAYVYNDKESIKKGEDGEYKNYIWKFSINKKVITILKDDEKNKKGTFYFVIQDILGFAYNDYLTVFNELDTAPLTSGIPFYIGSFSSIKNYTLTVDAKNDEIFVLNYRNFLKDKHYTVNVFFEEKSIYNTEKASISNYTYAAKQPGKYYIKIAYILGETEDDGLHKIGVIVDVSKRTVRKLEENKSITIHYIDQNSFLFYFDITKFPVNQTQVVTIVFPHEIVLDKNLRGVFGVVIYSSTEDDEVFKQHVPKTDKENKFLSGFAEQSDNYYHLYYNKVNSSENYLLINVSLKKGARGKFNPGKFLISASSPIIEEFLGKNFPNVTKEIELENLVPQFYQIRIAKTKRLSYAAFASEEDIQTIINGTLVKNGKIAPVSSNKQVYAISRQGKREEIVYTFKFFGLKQKFTFVLEKIPEEIVYFHDYRPSRPVNKQIMKRGESFYIISSYDKPVETRIYLEEIFGDFELYYKSNITVNDSSIFPDERHIVKDKFTKVDGKLEVIGVKCKYPGMFNLHLLASKEPYKLYMNTEKFFYFNDSLKLAIPWGEFDAELSSPFGKEIHITKKKEEYTLNKNNKIIHFSQKSKDEEVIELKTDGIGLMKGTLAKKGLFVVKEEGDNENKDQRIIFRLKKDTNYKSVNIRITPIDGYLYRFGRQIDSKLDYIPMISEKKGYDLTTGNASLVFTNPYDKYPIPDDYPEDSTYYICFFLQSKNTTMNIHFSYEEKNKQEEAPEKKFVEINKTNTKFQLKRENDPTKPLTIIATTCGNIKYLTLSYYEEQLSDIVLEKKLNIITEQNYLIDLQLGFKMKSGSAFNNYTSLKFIYTYDGFDENVSKAINKDLNITQESSNKISWTPIEIPGKKVTYEVYIISNTSSYLNYLNNECYLSSLKTKAANNSLGSTELIYKVTTETSYTLPKKGVYRVNIIAFFGEDLPFRIPYYYIEFDSSKSAINSFWIFIFIGIGFALVTILLIIFLIFRKKKRAKATLPKKGEVLLKDSISED